MKWTSLTRPSTMDTFLYCHAGIVMDTIKPSFAAKTINPTTSGATIHPSFPSAKTSAPVPTGKETNLKIP
jgi:hypothetical protein